MKLSIVSTLYQSASYIEEFCGRVTASAQQLVGDDYEIILVNDGSPDNSLDIAVNLTKKDPRLIVVDLSRNFGHHKAMMTGLAHAKGNLVFLLDSDLEEEPEWLIPFARQMEEDQCDVVYGVQKKRKGGWFEQKSGDVFYFVYRKLLGIDLPKNLVTARIMSRRYVNALLLHREREIVIGGLWLITGFKQEAQLIQKNSSSDTSYSLRLKLSILVSSITSFSNSLLKAIFFIGLFTFLMSLVYVLFLICNWLFFSNPLSGWTSIVASIWLFGGLQICFFGIVGIYISKIFIETKNRPITIVRDVYSTNSSFRKINE